MTPSCRPDGYLTGLARLSGGDSLLAAAGDMSEREAVETVALLQLDMVRKR